MTQLPVLASTQSLAVRQGGEIGEAFTGWESRNHYQIHGPDGAPIYIAAETSAGALAFLARGFLKNKRPFTIEVREPGGELALTVTRPWRFFLSRAEVYGPDGMMIGAVQQRFSLLRRRYSLEGPGGEPVAELVGPVFRPWSFRLEKDGAEVGSIAKQWSGLLKEAMTDADNFGVSFGPALSAEERGVCLGATFLIDFVHFENSD